MYASPASTASLSFKGAPVRTSTCPSAFKSPAATDQPMFSPAWLLGPLFESVKVVDGSILTGYSAAARAAAGHTVSRRPAVPVSYQHSVTREAASIAKGAGNRAAGSPSTTISQSPVPPDVRVARESEVPS